jgi:predicted nucleic acid-binding protein
MKLYLETTMFNYFFDADRDGHVATVAVFEAIGRGEFDGYTSVVTLAELDRAPEPKRTEMLALVERFGITVLDNDEYKVLAARYLSEGVIPVTHPDDSAHIAIASVNEIDCVLSFNYKHINKLKTKKRTTEINAAFGFGAVVISTPMEVLDNEKA